MYIKLKYIINNNIQKIYLVLNNLNFRFKLVIK